MLNSYAGWPHKKAGNSNGPGFEQNDFFKHFFHGRKGKFIDRGSTSTVTIMRHFHFSHEVCSNTILQLALLSPYMYDVRIGFSSLLMFQSIYKDLVKHCLVSKLLSLKESQSMNPNGLSTANIPQPTAN